MEIVTPQPLQAGLAATPPPVLAVTPPPQNESSSPSLEAAAPATPPQQTAVELPSTPDEEVPTSQESAPTGALPEAPIHMSETAEVGDADFEVMDTGDPTSAACTPPPVPTPIAGTPGVTLPPTAQSQLLVTVESAVMGMGSMVAGLQLP